MARGVLVTGAARGIGRAVATAFAQLGDRVAVHYATSAEAAEATLAALPGEGHVVIGGDLTDPARAEAVVAETVTALGGLDVVVNNSAAMIRHPLAETSYVDWQEAWRETFAVNLFAA